jgi:hypothetical protein
MNPNNNGKTFGTLKKERTVRGRRGGKKSDVRTPFLLR